MEEVPSKFDLIISVRISKEEYQSCRLDKMCEINDESAGDTSKSLVMYCRSKKERN